MCQGLQIFRAMEHPCLPILYIDQDNPKKLTNLKRTVNYQLSMHYGFRNICIYYWKILKTLSLRMSDQFIQLQEQNVPPPQPPVVMEWSMLCCIFPPTLGVVLSSRPPGILTNSTVKFMHRNCSQSLENIPPHPSFN